MNSTALFRIPVLGFVCSGTYRHETKLNRGTTMASNGTIAIDMHAHVFSPSAKALMDKHYKPSEILTPDRDPLHVLCPPRVDGGRQ